jgi:hypothetical protein
MLLDLLIEHSACFGKDFGFFRLRDLEFGFLQPRLEIRIIRTVSEAIAWTEAPLDKFPGVISNW